MDPDTEVSYVRAVATLGIFIVSLFAVTFPSLSKRISFLRIPRIVFFIGKHFGTGVILSTAFVHLLQDSFDALKSPPVLARWRIGEHVGLIVLCSLLAIFLIEYISTSYVDRLQSYSSAPSSIASTPRDEFPVDLERATPPSKFSSAERSAAEQTPLIETTNSQTTLSNPCPDSSYGSVRQQVHVHDLGHSVATEYFEGHHRHESRSAHLSHHGRTRPSAMYGPEEIPQGQTSNLYHIHHTELGHHHHHGFEDADGLTHSHEHHFHQHHPDDLQGDGVKMGKKRQIVGILVLQLGIMIHSIIVGLTLSVTSGADFTTLLIALIFHQLFEGLSLGIRISSLPSPQEPGFKYLSMLKPTLACLFAITTPTGILLGMLIFGHNDDIAHLRFTQGLMSAISAGMLTYAACVEMLAGDFVMDPTLWRSSVRKQVLALFSLGAGVAAMAMVGF